MSSPALWAVCSITTMSLPGGTVGVAYSAGLSSSGCGSAFSLTWSVAGGSLPPGTSIHSHVNPAGDGNVSGVPTTAGVFTFTAKVTDGGSNTAFQILSISIASIAPSFSITSLPRAMVGSTYSFTLSASGGSGGYTYSLLSGSLPAPLVLSPAGVISGGPITTPGYSSFTAKVCDSSAQCANRSFFIGAFPALDSYQALSGVAVPGCTPGYFQTLKIGNQWELASPSCNRAFLLGVQNSISGWLTSLGISRYPSGLTPSFYTRSWAQIQNWGFNAATEFSDVKFFDGTSGPTPFITIIRPWAFATGISGRKCSVSNIQVKQIDSVSPQLLPASVYSLVSHPGMLDVFDPEWAAHCAAASVSGTVGVNGDNGTYTNQPGLATNARAIAVTLDEIDEWGWEKGTGSASYPVCNTAYCVAVSNFCTASIGSTSGTAMACNSGPNNHPFWSKYALTCGISGVDFGFGVGKSFLQSASGPNYANIAALNAAWGTSYTTFCDAGGWSDGGTTSTGLLDENGTLTAGIGGAASPWAMATINATAKADLENFNRQYAVMQYGPQIAAIRAVDTHHIIASSNYYGGTTSAACDTPPDTKFLLGFKDACTANSASCILVGCHDPNASGTDTLNKAMYDATGLPMYPWVSMSANADSFWCPGHCSSPISDYPIQSVRGAHYATTLSDLANAQSTGGDYYNVGLDWWGLTDGATSEHINLGLISNNDNAYDGNSAIIAPGLDPYSYATGGEVSNFGNFLASVTQANLNLLASFSGVSSPTALNNVTVNNVTVH